MRSFSCGNISNHAFQEVNSCRVQSRCSISQSCRCRFQDNMAAPHRHRTSKAKVKDYQHACTSLQLMVKTGPHLPPNWMTIVNTFRIISISWVDQPLFCSHSQGTSESYKGALNRKRKHMHAEGAEQTIELLKDQKKQNKSIQPNDAE